MNKRIDKTLLVSEIFPPRIGGSGSWLWEIYQRLPSSRYAVLAGDHSGAAAFDERGRIDITRTNLSSPTWSLLEFKGIRFYAGICRKIRRLVRDRSVSHLQCARVMPEGVAGYFCERLFGIPYTCYVHGEDITLAAESRESRFVVKHVLNRATRLVCNSMNTSHLLTSDWPVDNSRIVVMNPGVDTERFAPISDDAELRDRFGWRDRKVILTVSRLEKRKGHDKMIEAMEIVRNAVPDSLYAIVGDGVEADTLRKAIETRGLERWVKIHDPATDEELPLFYQSCDLFILPNRTIGSSIEGFGIVLLEAQACGKPVIAGDSGGTLETMEQGITGVIVDATDPKIIATEVIRLLRDDDERKAMGTRARKRMLEYFDWPMLAARAASVFDTP